MRAHNLPPPQQCLERCSVPLQQSKQVVESEIAQFQHRLQQCAQGCQQEAQNTIQDKQIAQTDQAAIDKVQAKHGSCITACFDEHMKIVPTMTKRIDDNLKKIKAP